MSLKEQLLKELRYQNAVAQREIEKWRNVIEAENISLTQVKDGAAFAGAARMACERRMQAAAAMKSQVEKKNAWIKEILSKYR